MTVNEKPDHQNGGGGGGGGGEEVRGSQSGQRCLSRGVTNEDVVEPLK